MNAVIKIIKKSMPSASIYLGIFCVLMIFFANLSVGNQDNQYAAYNMDIVIQDSDNSTLSQGLIDYLSKDNRVTVNVEEKSITNKVFQGYYDYVLYIPSGFEQEFVENPQNCTLEQLSINASVAFLNQKTDQFLRYVRTGLAMEKTMEEAVELAKECKEISAETGFLGKSKAIYDNRGFYFLAYLSYILPAVMILIIGPVLQSFFNVQIRMRTQSSATNQRKLILAMTAGAAVVSVVIFLLLMLLGATFFLSEFTSTGYLFACLNAFLMMVVSLAIAILVGILLPGRQALQGACNIISMGMSFLCGVFVQQELLPDYVQKIGTFLPVSWYMKNTKLLFQEDFTQQLGSFFTNIGVMAAFTAAIFCMALVAFGKKKTI